MRVSPSSKPANTFSTHRAKDVCPCLRLRGTSARRLESDNKKTTENTTHLSEEAERYAQWRAAAAAAAGWMRERERERNPLSCPLAPGAQNVMCVRACVIPAVNRGGAARD